MRAEFTMRKKYHMELFTSVRVTMQTNNDIFQQVSSAERKETKSKAKQVQ